MKESTIKNACTVYLILAKDLTVKVGISKEPKRRINTIRTTSGKHITKTYVSEYISNAGEIESRFKKQFHSKAICGEWFDVDYDEALKELKSLFVNYSKIEVKEDENNCLDELADFATGATQIMNRMAMVESGVSDEKQMREIETPIARLTRSTHCETRSVFKTFWEMAYRAVGLETWRDLFETDEMTLRKIIIIEMILSDVVQKGITDRAHYKEIYKDCKSRLQTVTELAYIGGIT